MNLRTIFARIVRSIVDVGRWIGLGISKCWSILMEPHRIDHRLSKKRAVLIGQAHELFLSNQAPDTEEKRKLIIEIEHLTQLMLNNLPRVYLRRGIIFTIILCLVYILWFARSAQTKIIVELTTSQVEMVLDSTHYGSTAKLQLDLYGSKHNTFISPENRTAIDTDPLDLDSSEVYFEPIDDKNEIRFRGVEVSMPSTVFLTKPDSMQLNLTFAPDSVSRKPIVVSWSFDFANRYIRQGEKRFTLSAYEQSKWRRFVFDDSTFSKEFTMRKPLPWKKATPFYVSHIYFRKDEHSAILNGTVRLIETSSEPFQLYERDRFEANFVDPVGVFVKSDSSGLKVSFQAEVSALKFGPDISRDNNDQMPDRLRTITDKAPYLLALIGILVTFIQYLFLRQRRSI